MASKSCDAFTLLELVVVLALAALWAMLLLPALARTQPNSKAVQCQNNLRQLTMAWRSYAADNRDILVVPAPSGATSSRPAWV
ncbi:MAG TPA: prepilin-type N-terminal cleavage/methylation domain-containing protein, partial [Candidatus Sulfotelmatobacter sp.]|nr:prepilin-type N-terminal cleavage/methylation domain-containing protein [Candidatus Sulfotelmatobacter sp.]